MSKLEAIANRAIFERQLSTDRAVRLVQREGNVDRHMAETAIKQVLLWYKKSRS